jgi:hypothetical protein
MSKNSGFDNNLHVVAHVTLVALLVIAATAAPSRGGTSEVRAFEQIRELAGSWTGTNSHGQPVEITFELVADGSAVLERFVVQREDKVEDMVTVYHLDGDRLLLTHYCVAGNQPRMVAKAISSEQVGFELVDATGMASPEAGHMHRAVLSFGDDDTFKAEWTWRENGEEPFTAVVEAQRTGREVATR